MENISQALKIDAPAVCQDIEELIRDTLDQLQRDGAVVGLSGGLDSAVAATLTVRSLGTGNVHLLNMPERDSKRIHRRHAQQLASHLGVKLGTQSISPILRASGTYRLLPLRWIPGNKLRSLLVDFVRSKLLIDRKDLLINRFHPERNVWMARGVAYAIAKHRFRMVVLYQYAELHNLMVVGAANRTEWLTGSFSKWGVDHCADVMPLLHLYRSQLEQIAAYIGVPDFIRNKPADPDLLPGVNDKGGLLGSFAEADHVLYGIENGVDVADLRRAYGEDEVDKILTLMELSEHMRASPYQYDR